MKSERRNATRYEEIGRVDSQELCALPGVMDDISETGCKVHFPVPVTLDMEREYDLTIRMPGKGEASSITLVSRPEWVREQGEGSALGFSFLPSQDFPKLQSLIKMLEELSSDEDESIMNMIVDLRPNFVTC